MDDAIVDRAGMSIPEIVEKFGWPYFRDLESAVAKDFASRDSILVDTGGGVIERPENMAALSVNACVIWLKASVDVIVARIEKETHRPALIRDKTFTEEVTEVLARRIDKYQIAAHVTIDTDSLGNEEIVEKIIAIWNNRSGNGYS
jgi:shikimate kinase